MRSPQPDPEALATLTSRWEDYFNDPVRFAYEIVGIEKLDRWQEEVMMALFGNPIDGSEPKSLAAVAAGTGVGKETVAALSILCFLCTRPQCKVAVLSASKQQVEVALWMELQKWISHSKVLPGMLEWTPSSVQVRGYGERWRAFQSIAAKRIAGVTGEAQAEGGAGIHETHLLIVISEASGVDDAQISAKLATLTGGEDNRLLMIGNPVRRHGYFYRVFTDPKVKQNWYTRHVRHDESSFVSKAASQWLIDENGLNSAIVQAKVFGQFPLLAEGKTIFGYDEVEQAFERNIDDNPELTIQVGVDCARYGDNETVVTLRRGFFTFPQVSAGKTSTLDTCFMVFREIVKRWRRSWDNPRPDYEVLTPDELTECQKEVLICVDEVGVGGGVVDNLRNQGWRVVGINNGSKPRNPRHYKSRGDELWFVDGKIAVSRAYIPRDEELQHQLCNREVRFDASGTKRRVETKDEMLRRGLPSPDKADSFLLAYATVTSQDSLDYRQALIFA